MALKLTPDCATIFRVNNCLWPASPSSYPTNCPIPRQPVTHIRYLYGPNSGAIWMYNQIHPLGPIIYNPIIRATIPSVTPLNPPSHMHNDSTYMCLNSPVTSPCTPHIVQPPPPSWASTLPNTSATANSSCLFFRKLRVTLLHPWFPSLGIVIIEWHWLMYWNVKNTRTAPHTNPLILKGWKYQPSAYPLGHK